MKILIHSKDISRFPESDMLKSMLRRKKRGAYYVLEGGMRMIMRWLFNKSLRYWPTLAAASDYGLLPQVCLRNETVQLRGKKLISRVRFINSTLETEQAYLTYCDLIGSKLLGKRLRVMRSEMSSNTLIAEKVRLSRLYAEHCRIFCDELVLRRAILEGCHIDARRIKLCPHSSLANCSFEREPEYHQIG